MASDSLITDLLLQARGQAGRHRRRRAEQQLLHVDRIGHHPAEAAVAAAVVVAVIVAAAVSVTQASIQ